ncbi:MAG: D-alanyl-D-alanine carboxypeptidase family protein [Acidobacteria bacterium]|nr:D-alanyl-D-alanine carboxypeptidase family protein [Acidobacteriota bacterium]
MKQKKTHLVVSFVALAALVGFVALVARTGYGRAQTEAQATAARPLALAPERRADESAPAAPAEKDAHAHVHADEKGASLFAAAAARNLLLKYELSWAFGGKQQRGWHLYTPLISRMIAMEGGASAGDFAEALSLWQKRSRLQPSGVLDGETLYRMVSEWQGARLKHKAHARPEELLLAPATDFYDPTRPEGLRHVERETYAAYKRMVAAAAADPTSGLRLTAAGDIAPAELFLKIVSAHRSPEYQARLRAQSPNSGRAGLAVNSPHFTGRALDLYVGGEPVETRDSNRAIQVQTPAYRWLVRNAERFGFRPYYYEPWHWEYVGAAAGAAK